MSVSAHANLKMAIVDTGFCPEKIKIKSKNQRILPVLDMTGTNHFDCKLATKKMLEESGRFHGQHVLKEFFKYLPKKIDLTVRPIMIYDRLGNQTAEAWKKTIDYIEKEKIDIVLTASGLVDGEKLVEELPSIWFIPSGRNERLINEKTTLFPQNLAPKPNIFVIGDYYDGNQIIYDQALKYQEQIDYYFPSGSGDFKGTSRAVAQAMAQALDKCLIEKDIIAAHSLRLCLLKYSKTLRDPLLKKDFKTF